MTLQPDPREMYAFADPAEDVPRACKHELVRQVKRLIELTAHLDTERLDPEEVGAVTEQASALADRLEPMPSLLEQGGMAAQDGAQGALLERSGISGRANPLAPPMQWHPDGEILRGWATYSPRTRVRSATCTAASWPPPSTTSWAWPRWLRASPATPAR